MDDRQSMRQQPNLAQNRIDVRDGKLRGKSKARSQRTRKSAEENDYSSMRARERERGAQTPDVEAIQTAQKKDRDPHNFVRDISESSSSDLDFVSQEKEHITAEKLKKFESESSSKSESSIESHTNYQNNIERLVAEFEKKNEQAKEKRRADKKQGRGKEEQKDSSQPPSAQKTTHGKAKKKDKQKKGRREREEQSSEEQKDQGKDGKEKEEEKEGEEQAHSSDESRDERERIAAIKKVILKEEKKRKKKLYRHFKKKPDDDITKGRCCCKYQNEQGAKIVHIFDILFIPNFIRWVFAVWAKVDEERLAIYARVRFFTFWIFWLILYGIVIGTSIEKAIEETESNVDIYINSFIYLSILMFGTIIDFHWSQVMLYYAKSEIRRLEREEKDRAKRERAKDRYIQKTTVQLNVEEGMPGPSESHGTMNPVIVPNRQRETDNYYQDRMKKKMDKIRDINGVELPDDLEAPAHWRKDLKRQIKKEEKSQEVKLMKKKINRVKNRNANKIVNHHDAY